MSFTCLSVHHRGWWGKALNCHLKINQACVDVIHSCHPLTKILKLLKILSKWHNGYQGIYSFGHFSGFPTESFQVLIVFDDDSQQTELIFEEGDLTTQLSI